LGRLVPDGVLDVWVYQAVSAVAGMDSIARDTLMMQARRMVQQRWGVSLPADGGSETLQDVDRVVALVAHRLLLTNGQVTPGDWDLVDWAGAACGLLVQV
jgi:hypothetical protein